MALVLTLTTHFRIKKTGRHMTCRFSGGNASGWAQLGRVAGHSMAQRVKLSSTGGNSILISGRPAIFRVTGSPVIAAL